MFSTAFLILLTIVTLAWLWLNLSPTWRGGFPDQLDLPDQPLEKLSNPPRVVIFCPGRNEADHIRTTLPELCQQDYENYHVVYIDDHSDDDTPAVTKEMETRFSHLTVVRNETDPPTGWVGKCWAIQKGYEAWQKREQETDEVAELVLFTDADIHWHPQCLPLAVQSMRDKDVDIFTLLLGMQHESVVESLALLTLTFGLFAVFPIKKALDPDDPEALCAGSFTLVKRELYDSINGHEAVKDRVVEDVNLGRALKRAGGKLWIMPAPRLLWGRMYEGWRDLFEGMSKNAYAGMEYNPLTAVHLLTAHLFVNILPPVYLIGSVVWLINAAGWMPVAATVMSAGILILQAVKIDRARRILELPALFSFSLPIGAAITWPMVFASVWRYYFGGNVWKGRSYGREVNESAET